MGVRRNGIVNYRMSLYSIAMSKLGPLPEQAFTDWLIPTTDLRDAIRMDHGLAPFYDEEAEERRPIAWDIWIPAIAALGIFLAWEFYPLAAIAVIALSFAVNRFMR